MRLVNVGRAAVIGVGMLGLCGVLAGPAAADPKGGEVVPLECDVNGSLSVVVPGNGQWTPGLVVGNNQVGVPYAFHIEGTFTPTGGAPQSFVEDSAKPAPRSGRLDRCTFHEEGSDESGTFEVDGVVLISYTPAH